MTKIIKLYLDIGCSYQGNEYIDNIYQDIENWNIKDCGIINMLKLEVDTQKRTTEEISFKQILGPMYKKFKCSIVDYRKYTSCILGELRDIDMVVTFNGRDFDIPIIINNLNISDKNREYHIKYFTNRDRDLLDICIIKDIPIKGGLKEIVRRLKIDYDIIVRRENRRENRKDDIEENRKDNRKDDIEENMCFLDDFDRYIGIYNSRLIARKRRNESDIRVLPLLEEKLGFLYEPRSFVDKYHKRWV